MCRLGQHLELFIMFPKTIPEQCVQCGRARAIREYHIPKGCTWFMTFPPPAVVPQWILVLSLPQVNGACTQLSTWCKGKWDSLDQMTFFNGPKVKFWCLRPHSRCFWWCTRVIMGYITTYAAECDIFTNYSHNLY